MNTYTKEEFTRLYQELHENAQTTGAFRHNTIWNCINEYLGAYNSPTKITEFHEERLKNLCNCIDPSTNNKYNVIPHIYKAIFEQPYEDMLLLINDTKSEVRIVAKWRLEMGK